MSNEDKFFKNAEEIEADSAFLDSIRHKVEKGFEVYDSTTDKKFITFKVKPRYSNEKSFDMVLKEFSDTKYFPFYRKTKEGFTISIAQVKTKKKKFKPYVHVTLLISTAITMTWAGYIWWADGDILKSIMFALALMAILGGHELGHAMLARIRGTKATLPFFIPAPPFFPFGTFGAVILMGSPVKNRKSLLDVGISGPLVGFFLSLPVLVIGLKLSHVIPVSALPEDEEFVFAMPLILQYLARSILGNIPPDSVIDPHPITMAGWAGLFVTSLNLLPMGQLDGGHIVRSIAPKNFKKIYYGVAIILLLLGLFWPGWILWGVLIWFMTRLEHPGPLDDVSELDRNRKILALLGLVVFVLSFMPVPIFPAGLIHR